MNCNAISLGITPLVLMTMSKNPALLQKVLEDWLRLPERQELFAGLMSTLYLFINFSYLSSIGLTFDLLI